MTRGAFLENFSAGRVCEHISGQPRIDPPCGRWVDFAARGVERWRLVSVDRKISAPPSDG
jgi:hypothetical protein